MTERRIVKLTVDMPADELDQLRRLAEEQDLTVTDAVRKAVATDRFLRSEVRNGSKVLLRKRNATYTEVTLP